MEWGIQFWAKLICVRVILYSSYPLRCVFMCATDEHPSHWVLLVCFYTLEGFPLLIHQRVQARKHLGWLLEYIYIFVHMYHNICRTAHCMYIYIFIHIYDTYIYTHDMLWFRASKHPHPHWVARTVLSSSSFRDFFRSVLLIPCRDP
jgi:hypothetical protein